MEGEGGDAGASHRGARALPAARRLPEEVEGALLLVRAPVLLAATVRPNGGRGPR